jgi:hypothetical protein
MIPAWIPATIGHERRPRWVVEGRQQLGLAHAALARLLQNLELTDAGSGCEYAAQACLQRNPDQAVRTAAILSTAWSSRPLRPAADAV